MLPKITAAPGVDAPVTLSTENEHFLVQTHQFIVHTFI